VVFFFRQVSAIENLTGPSRQSGKRFLFSCLPLILADANGCPVRSAAMVE